MTKKKISVVERQTNLSRLALMSTIELLVWAMFMLTPVASFAGVLPMKMLIDAHDDFLPLIRSFGIQDPAAHVTYSFAFFYFLLTPLILVIGLILLAFVLELVLGIFRSRTEPVPKYLRAKIDESLNMLENSGLPQLSSANIRYIPYDLKLGAHVRGVFIPKVVVSAGTLACIAKRDQRAMAILAHEMAHIKHWDILYIGLLCLFLIEIGLGIREIGPVIRNWFHHDLDMNIFLVTMINFLVAMVAKIGIFGFFSKRREYGADFAAATVVGKDTYLKTISLAKPIHSGGYGRFHPSLSDRLEAISSGYRIVRFGWAFYTLILLCTVYYLYLHGQFLEPLSYILYYFRDNETGFSNALAILLYGLIVELLRLTIRTPD